MKRLCFWGLICMFGIQVLSGANVVREARKTIKKARYEEDGNAANNVRNSLLATEKSLLDAIPAEKKNGKRAQLYYTAALVQSKFNDIENEKIYLKRAYDTARYYNSIYQMYRYLEQCDSVEHITGKYKRRPSAREILLENRANLLNGCRFYLRKQNFTEAYRLMDLYLYSAEYPMLKQDFLNQTDTMYQRVAYWMVAVSYHIGKYQGVIKYAPVALRYAKNEQSIHEYFCKSHLALGDTAAWLHGLKRGIANFPDHAYYFTSLLEYLNTHSKYDEILLFADKMIQYDPKKTLFWYAKALAYLHKNDYKNCITNCDVVLKLDSTHVDAYYFKGLVFCNKAKSVSEEMKKETLKSVRYQVFKKEMTDLYVMAEAPLEKMRKLSPEQAERWAPLLYQVYLNLNKGKEFDEIENVMRVLKTTDNQQT